MNWMEERTLKPGGRGRPILSPATEQYIAQNHPAFKHGFTTVTNTRLELPPGESPRAEKGGSARKRTTVRVKVPHPENLIPRCCDDQEEQPLRDVEPFTFDMKRPLKLCSEIPECLMPPRSTLRPRLGGREIPRMHVRHTHRRRPPPPASLELFRCQLDRGECACPTMDLGRVCDRLQKRGASCVRNCAANCCRGGGAYKTLPPFPVPPSALNFVRVEEDEAPAEHERVGPGGLAPARSGYRGFCEDVVGLSAVVLSRAAELFIRTSSRVLPHDDEAYSCHRQYLIQKPTHYTGNRLIDRINHFLDSALVDRPQPEAKNRWRGPPADPPTKPTGWKPVDALNQWLDNLLVPAGQEQPEEEARGGREVAKLPRQTMKQRMRCLMQCRSRCAEGREDCAGLAFQRTFKDEFANEGVHCNNPDHSILDGKVSGSQYKPKFAENYIPRMYNREAFFCPHCEKHRITGKQRKSLLPDWKLDCATQCFNAPPHRQETDLVDFDLRDFLS